MEKKKLDHVSTFSTNTTKYQNGLTTSFLMIALLDNLFMLLELGSHI